MTRTTNYITFEFLSRSANEGFARGAVACFAAQLDPTLEELGDIKTAVSGMGFTIMESFMDKLTVRSAEGKGTRVTMRRRILPRPASK